MLNSKAINELLSRNRDGKLCKRWYLMTPNGTLLAYSQPVDINDLRKQAAIAAICWQEHRSQDARGDNGADYPGEIREDGEQNPLHTLIIESEVSNIIMRQIQKQLLLVLEGGVPPRRAVFVKTITAEGANGARLQSNQTAGDSSATSNVASDTNVSKGGSNALKLQRKKLDGLADVILRDFEATGFRMPEGSITF
ncbi:hypothetical protein CB0940_01106 [Cercospora beticola]|uniref:Uncharacterized protein n=1 Tax=Cercospora beticola TaxID=122368 RepID=A0A2G5ICT3_CERBT|nr:hypothetical protein CB0940_01106 [Cercospora beticola]PIB02666.1 hypothetical protein CB0940_01106 [Cercospora beticola]WPA96534.1 hypothetical protein RHO25_001141 [Cercospora beticola]